MGYGSRLSFKIAIENSPIMSLHNDGGSRY
jgi:hypothetical protein